MRRKTYNEYIPLTAEPEFEEVKRLLTELSVPYIRVTKHQIKIGEINYYPITGTITRDNFPRLNVKGIEALRAALLKRFPTAAAPTHANEPFGDLTQLN